MTTNTRFFAAQQAMCDVQVQIQSCSGQNDSADDKCKLGSKFVLQISSSVTVIRFRCRKLICLPRWILSAASMERSAWPTRPLLQVCTCTPSIHANFHSAASKARQTWRASLTSKIPKKLPLTPSPRPIFVHIRCLFQAGSAPTRSTTSVTTTWWLRASWC